MGTGVAEIVMTSLLSLVHSIENRTMCYTLPP
jgi:hypothetical protein